MRITFYNNHHYWGGLGNQGGSRTILLSAEALRKLGHRVDIVACADKFTWFPHPPIKHKVPKDTDVIIAVSISGVKELYKKYSNYKIAYWARPFETWQKSEEKCIKILKKFRKADGIIMCNSGWQVGWLKYKGIKSHLVYSGQDLGCQYKPDYDPEFKLTIGCQYSSKPRKGWKEFKKIAEILGDKYEYVAFGSEKCKDRFLSKYLKKPSRERLNQFYQTMDVFFIGNQLEGFYNCPVEATMNGCLLICNNNPKCGAHDYCNEETAHMYNPQFLNCNQMLAIFDNLDFAKVKKCQQLIRNQIGSRETNMKRMVEVLS